MLLQRLQKNKLLPNRLLLQ